MKFVELSTEIGEMMKVSDLPEEIREIITDDNKSVMVVPYPLNSTNNLIISPTLDWDMGNENIGRMIVNLKAVSSVGIFNGPSCDIYEKIDEKETAWIYYTIMEECLLLKI